MTGRDLMGAVWLLLLAAVVVAGLLVGGAIVALTGGPS